MKPRSLFTLRQTTRATAAGFLLASSVLPAAAGTEFLWSASAATTNLGTGSNWDGGTAPATSTNPTTSQNTDIMVFTNAAQAGVLAYGASRNLGGVEFRGANVGSYTLPNTGGANPRMIMTLGGKISMDADVPVSQAFNRLGFSGASGSYNIENLATSSTATLSLTTGIVNYSTAAMTMFIGGTNRGANTITAPITENTGAGALTLRKSGVGTWLINATSSYVGGTILDQGTLAIRTSTSPLGSASGAFTINGGTFGSVVSPRSVANNLIINNNFQLGGVNVPGLANADTTFTGSVNLGGGARTVTLGNSATFSNEISNGGLDVVSSGSARTLNLGGANSYSGATSVGTNVTLAITDTGSINSTSGISVAAGGTFRYNSSTALTVSPTLNGTGTGSGQRAVLSGTGPIDAAVALDNPGDVISPGNSPGIQTYTVGQSWSSFSYDWELNNFTDTTAGTAFDQIGITGTLALTGGSDSYILNVLGLTEGNAAGLVSNFSEINRSWTILTSTGITGFNAAHWTIDTDGFTNPDTGNWSLDQVGNNLVLSYAPIPEPRAALLGSLGMLMLLRRRRA